MASAKKKAAKAQKAALQARYNPYVQKVVDDEDLRSEIVQAYESSRDAFSRLSNGKSPSKQLFDDKKLQKDLKQAAESIRDATVALREAPKKQRSGGFGRVLLLGIVGAGAGARALRGAAQEGPGRAVRRRGGVRVHLDDDLRADAAGDRRQHDLAGSPPARLRRRAPWRAPFSFNGRPPTRGITTPFSAG